MIDVKQVITSAKLQLRIESADMDAWFEKLANEGVRHLDSLNLWVKKVMVLDVKDNAVRLPDNFRRIIALRLGADGDCTQAMYVELPFIKQCGCSQTVDTLDSTGIFEIQGNQIVFHNDIDATQVTLAYFGFREEDGLLQIEDDYERALTAYICWKYTVANFQEYPPNVQQHYMMEWAAQKKWIKSNEVYDHFKRTKRQVAEVVKALLTDKVWDV